MNILDTTLILLNKVIENPSEYSLTLWSVNDSGYLDVIRKSTEDSIRIGWTKGTLDLSCPTYWGYLKRINISETEFYKLKLCLTKLKEVIEDDYIINRLHKVAYNKDNKEVTINDLDA